MKRRAIIWLKNRSEKQAGCSLFPGCGYTVIASSLVVIAMLPGNQHRVQEVTAKNRNSQNKGDVTCLLVSLRFPGRQI